MSIVKLALHLPLGSEGSINCYKESSEELSHVYRIPTNTYSLLVERTKRLSRDELHAEPVLN